MSWIFQKWVIFSHDPWNPWNPWPQQWWIVGPTLCIFFTRAMGSARLVAPILKTEKCDLMLRVTAQKNVGLFLWPEKSILNKDLK